MPILSMNACVHVRISRVKLSLVCRNCIATYFHFNNKGKKCPGCGTEIRARIDDFLIKDVLFQNITDWLMPQFKMQEDKIRENFLQPINEKRKANTSK